MDRVSESDEGINDNYYVYSREASRAKLLVEGVKKRNSLYESGKPDSVKPFSTTRKRNERP